MLKWCIKKNDGLGQARNSGMEVATGEYIAFVDSDDFIDADMMERLYDECKEHIFRCNLF